MRPTRRRLGPPRWTRSAIALRLATRSLCPHCGRDSATVQGVCADCWGSKSGRELWHRGTARPLPVSPYVLGGGLALLLPLAVVLLWISG